MAGIKKEQFDAIQESAMAIVADFGIKRIDAIETSIRKFILRGWAAQLMAEHDITLQTARQHIAKACRRQRDPSWQPAQNWGGEREGAGRR